MQRIKIILVIIVAMTVSLALLPSVISEEVEYIKKEEAASSTTILITHPQIVWVHALEWCESSGNIQAINPMDNDGTPSYYSFQFKPSTFKGYALRYKLLDPSLLTTEQDIIKQMSNYDIQTKIIYNMMLDNRVKWANEFPACIKKIGLPPRP